MKTVKFLESKLLSALCTKLITQIWVTSPTIKIYTNPIFSSENFNQNKSADAFHHHILLSSLNRTNFTLNWYNQRKTLSK